MLKNILKIFLPVSLSSIIIVSFMYLVCPSYYLICVLASFLVCFGYFAIFNYLRTKGKIGYIHYTAVFIIVILLAYAILSKVSSNPIDDIKMYVLFGLVDSSKEIKLSISVFLVLAFFISSFIYYYTIIIYKSTIIFMAMFIPLMLYVKRMSSMPVLLVVLLSVTYIANMIYYRQIYNDKDFVVKMNKNYRKTTVIFLMTITLIVALIPIPKHTPFIEKTQNFLNKSYSNLTDNDGSDGYTSEGRNYFSGNLQNVVLEVESNQPIYLKTNVYDMFNSNNSWTLCENDEYILGYKDWDTRFLQNNYGKFLSIVSKAAQNDNKFALKYNISKELINANFSDSEEFEVKINCKTDKLKDIPNMLDIVKFNFDYDDMIFRTYNGFMWNKDKSLKNDIQYSLTWLNNQEFFKDENVTKFISSFDYQTYNNFLNDLIIITNKYLDDKDSQYINYILNDLKKANDYYIATLASNDDSQLIMNMVDEATKGSTSDYDKALKILNAFSSYTYDLNYKPPMDKDTLEYFLFESKTGICIDFASAMCVLAREAGLPARYVEGYIVQESTGSDKYVVREKDGHAYAEVYICGYGWMIFDPTTVVQTAQETINNNVNEKQKSTISNITPALSKLAVGILAGILLLVIAFFLLKEKLSELLFRLNIVFAKDDNKINKLFCHIRVILGKRYNINPDYFTPQQVLDFFNENKSANIKYLIKIFEEHCYADQKISKEQFAIAFREYKLMYRKLQSSNKWQTLMQKKD